MPIVTLGDLKGTKSTAARPIKTPTTIRTRTTRAGKASEGRTLADFYKDGGPEATTTVLEPPKPSSNGALGATTIQTQADLDKSKKRKADSSWVDEEDFDLEWDLDFETPVTDGEDTDVQFADEDDIMPDEDEKPTKKGKPRGKGKTIKSRGYGEQKHKKQKVKK